MFRTPLRSRYGRSAFAGAAVVFLVAMSSRAAAQSDAREGGDAAVPAIGAELETDVKLVEARPVLDGNVLDDPAWRDAPAIDRFWQTTPDEGAPASEQTEVRIVYTRDTLYIGVVAYDRYPQQITIAGNQRDSSLQETDSFAVILDTYHDRQNGFVFGTNPAGIQYDGQVTNEGQGTGGLGPQSSGGSGNQRQEGGSGGGFNVNWDGSWNVRTLVSDIGWSAEFAIPFRTLRYPGGDSQTWGINFQRNLRRRNETAFWAPLPRQHNLYRLSLAGRLTGLDIPPQRVLQLTPYVLGQSRQDGTRPSGATSLGDAGVDLKYGVTPSLTLDVTYNTDFAQVEVDEQQINFDRFNLFFPEKRPFFLENAGLFSVGSPGEAEVFFSRSIGIGKDGRVNPILGGARLSGRMGRTNIGVLNMQTEETAGAQGNNFSVARVNRELPNRSAIGAIFVNRQGTGDLARDGDYNRSYAVDGRWGIGQNGLISAFVAKTATPGAQGRQYAHRTSAGYESQKWLLTANYSEVGENFNPEVGFYRRRGFRKFDTHIHRTYRITNMGPLHEFRPHMTFRGFWDFDGFQETGYAHFDQELETKSGHEFRSALNLTREGVTQAFEIFPGIVVPPGTYDHKETNMTFFTNEGAPFSFRTQVIAGGFFGGSRVRLQPEVNFRIRDTLVGELRLSRNDISLPAGHFITNLFISRIAYSFTPSMFVQSLIQYNDGANVWSTNLRFGWYQKGGAGFFIVYNDTQGLADSSLMRPDRSLVVKVSRMFDLLH